MKATTTQQRRFEHLEWERGSMNFLSDTALTDLMDIFIAKCIAGAALITPEALKLLGLLAIIDLALILILTVLGPGEDILALLAKKIIKYGFFIWLIENWSTGMQITKQIFNFFANMGSTAAGVTVAMNDPAYIAEKGIIMAESILSSVWPLGIGSIGIILIKSVMAFVMFGLYAFMAIYVFNTVIQFYILGTLTTVLLPFGVNKYTSFLSEKAIGAMFSISIKMMVLQFILCIIAPFMESIQPISPISTNIAEILRILIGCAGMALIVKEAPGMAQDYLSGNPTFGDGAAGAAGGMAKSAGGMASSAAGGVMKGAGMVKAAANADGGRGSNGRISTLGTARNLGKMARQSMPDRQAQTHGKQLFRAGKTLNDDKRKVKEQQNIKNDSSYF
jgi:type IV secretion system protein TrbL